MLCSAENPTIIAYVKKRRPSPYLAVELVVYTINVYTIPMLKNVTLSAEEAKIQEVRRLAMRDNTTLNQLFRDWLDQYIARDRAARQYQELVQQIGLRFDRKFTREEMNERR